MAFQTRTGLLVVFLTTSAARAQDAAPALLPPQPSQAVADSAPLGADPPSRVARLSIVKGPVSYKAAGDANWSVAQANHPVTKGDSVWVDDQAQAEIQVGTVAVRLAANSSLYVPNLDETTVQLSLTQGGATVRVRQVAEGDLLEVDLPNAAITLQQAGNYRFDVTNEGTDSTVTLRGGARAEMMVGGQVVDIEDGHAEDIHGLDGASVQERELPQPDQPDALDTFSTQREQVAEQATASLQYVSPNTVGYEDLAQNGEWMNSPDYGMVWAPTVPTGWAPYRFGHWDYIEPWGWVWIDDAPWGYAPFHYGRWNYWGNRWCWWPGPVVHHPVWAPALVGWSHHGAGVSWWPLGYHEPFVPGYHVSYNYVRAMNPLQHFSNIGELQAHEHFANRGVANAVTTVPPSVFHNGSSVAASHRPISAGEAMHGPVENRGPAFNGPPVHTGAVVVPHPPAASVDRRTIYRATPPGRPGGAPVTYAQPPARPATSISPTRPTVITRVPVAQPVITRVQQPQHDAYDGRVPMPSNYEPNFHPYVRPNVGFSPAPHYAAPHFAAPRAVAPAPHFSAPAPHFAPAPAGGFHGGGGGGGHHR